MGKNKAQRINKACAYFPCHKQLDDCTFCYCPFYPCGDDNKGGFIYTKDKRKIWSCQNCKWIHKKNVVDGILNLVRARYKPVMIKPKSDSGRIGVIILSHGSKLKNANNTMIKLVGAVKKELGLKNIFPAYLQFHQPDLSKTVRHLAGKRCKKIIIVPFFLFRGNHVSLDVPNAINKEKDRYPQVSFIYTHNLGPDARLSEIVIDRISEAMRCTQKK